jgi:hypothetical protein
MSDERRLQMLLEEATVDCYDEEEEFMGMIITLNERLAWPLTAQWASQTVEVLGLDESVSSLRRGMVANVRREGREYTIGLADLTFIDLDKTSAEWLAMFHWWAASS